MEDRIRLALSARISPVFRPAPPRLTMRTEPTARSIQAPKLSARTVLREKRRGEMRFRMLISMSNTGIVAPHPHQRGSMYVRTSFQHRNAAAGNIMHRRDN